MMMMMMMIPRRRALTPDAVRSVQAVWGLRGCRVFTYTSMYVYSGASRPGRLYGVELRLQTWLAGKSLENNTFA